MRNIPSKRILTISVVCLVTLGLFWFSIPKVQSGPGHDHGPPPTTETTGGPKQLSPQAKANIGLKTEDVDFHTIESVISVMGSVKAQPKQRATVTPQIKGVVKQVDFNLGDTVQKGETLLQLESLEFQADQIALIEAKQQVDRLKDALDDLKTVSAKKIRLELADRQINYLQSLKARNRHKAQLLKLKTVSVGKITAELERRRVELVKANVQLQLLEASLKRAEALAEKRISAKKELLAKQAEYAQGKSTLDSAKRGFLMLGITDKTVEKILNASGDEPIESLLGLDPTFESFLEKYVVLLDSATELVAAEAAYYQAVDHFEMDGQRALAAGLTETQLKELSETGTIASLRQLSTEALLENYVALLSEPKALVDAESAYKNATIAMNRMGSRLQTLGLTEAEISEIVSKELVEKRIEVVAPARGQIVAQTVSVGATVEPTDTLFEILNTETVWIEGDVNENTLNAIAVGQKVRIRLPAYPQNSLTGKVSSIFGVMDALKRTAHIWVEVGNREGKLLPGMFAELSVVTGSQDEVIAVPLAAVLGDGVERFVFVEAGDLYEQREVAVGAKDDRYVEVKDGLFPGDIVVVQGNYELMSASTTSPAAEPAHPHPH